jgi:hypothetical protein
MFQVNAWFVESSYGNLSLLPTVSPRVILPRTEAWYISHGSEFDLADDAVAASRGLLRA